MTASLERFAAAGVLTSLDVQFARCVGRLAGSEDQLVLLGAAAATRAPSRGHTCAELTRLAGRPATGAAGLAVEGLVWPHLDGGLAARRAGAAGREAGVSGEPRPLVLDGAGRLYLERFRRYERGLADALLARCDGDDRPLSTDWLDRLFPLTDGAPDMQRLAAEVAATGRLAVVSGGPGTGKTTTVVRMLALLQAQAREAGGKPLRVQLVAPTGKAAARMVDAIRRNKAGLPDDAELRAAVPEEAATIHRALGVRRDQPTRFVHDRERPLSADVVVVDEASMVDLALMHKLADAVRPDARLVLLGDRDQLASVEAGAIFGDVCNVGGQTGPSPLDARRNTVV